MPTHILTTEKNASFTQEAKGRLKLKVNHSKELES
jgi:hypothetical protein